MRASRTLWIALSFLTIAPATVLAHPRGPQPSRPSRARAHDAVALSRRAFAEEITAHQVGRAPAQRRAGLRAGHALRARATDALVAEERALGSALPRDASEFHNRAALRQRIASAYESEGSVAASLGDFEQADARRSMAASYHVATAEDLIRAGSLGGAAAALDLASSAQSRIQGSSRTVEQRRLSPEQTLARIYRSPVGVPRMLGDALQRIVDLEQAIAAASTLESPVLIADLSMRLAQVQHETERPDDAVASYRAAVQNYLAAGDSNGARDATVQMQAAAEAQSRRAARPGFEHRRRPPASRR